MSWEPRPGAAAYLVPTLPTAPRAAYAMPRCEVVRVDGPRITVLVDGAEVTTDRANIRATRPEVAGRRPRPAPPRRPMPDGYAEPMLF